MLEALFRTINGSITRGRLNRPSERSWYVAQHTYPHTSPTKPHAGTVPVRNLFGAWGSGFGV